MIGSFLRRIDRVAGRFSKWLAPTAIASGTKGGEPPAVDPSRVAAILGELERSDRRPLRGEQSGREEPG